MAMLPPRKSPPKTTLTFASPPPVRENRAVFPKDDETLAFADERPMAIVRPRSTRLPPPPVSTGVDSEATLVAAPRWRQGSELRTPVPPSVIVSPSLIVPVVSPISPSSSQSLAPVVMDWELTPEPVVEPVVAPFVEPATTVLSKKVVPRASTAARIGMLSACVCTVLAIASFTFAIMIRSNARHEAANAAEPVAMLSMPAAGVAPMPMPEATMIAPQLELAATAKLPTNEKPSDKPRQKIETRAGSHAVASAKPRMSAAPVRPQAAIKKPTAPAAHAAPSTDEAVASQRAADDARDIMARAL